TDPARCFRGLGGTTSVSGGRDRGAAPFRPRGAGAGGEAENRERPFAHARGAREAGDDHGGGPPRERGVENVAPHGLAAFGHSGGDPRSSSRHRGARAPSRGGGP